MLKEQEGLATNELETLSFRSDLLGSSWCRKLCAAGDHYVPGTCQLLISEVPGVFLLYSL